MKKFESLAGAEHLCIYVTGSYGRGEASPNSDLDIFFVDTKPMSGPEDKPSLSRIGKTLVDAELIKLCRDEGFQPFSDDGKYLETHNIGALTGQMGSQEEDASNVFTARLLLLLESAWLFNDTAYGKAITECVGVYFRDYHDHEKEFRPIFLVNDIQRFWKTLCLNYEHKRHRLPPGDTAKKNKSHLKNFKLKFSRALTCFSMIAQLCRSRATITEAEAIQLVRTPPWERVLQLTKDFNLTDIEERLLGEYAWFLEMTAKTQDEQLEWISDKSQRNAAFDRARTFGNGLFALVQEVAKGTDILRYLVV